MQATARDQETFDQLRRLISENGYAPSVRELGAALGLASSNTTQKRLERLVRLGWVQKARGLSRTIKITDEGGNEL